VYCLWQLQQDSANFIVIDIEFYIYESSDSNISLFGNLKFFLLYFVNNDMLRRLCNINCTIERFVLWTKNNRTCSIIRCFVVVSAAAAAAAAVIIFISENLLPTERSTK